MYIYSLRNSIRLIAALIFTIGAVMLSVYADKETSTDTIVRVGLNYSSTAVDSAEISNSGGFTVTVAGYEEAPINIDVNTLHLSVRSGSLHVSTMFGGDVATAQNGIKISVSSANEEDVISFNGTAYYGSLEFYANIDSNIVVINALSIEDYLKGVLPSEVYPSWNMEALKAAAVVSRTYALRNVSLSSHTLSGFDICSTTHCQMYSGTKKENERTNQAIDETNGMVVMYNGSLAMTPYHSSNGGYTETAAGAWGGSPDNYPYLTNVRTPYEDYRNVPNGKWESVILPANLIDYIPEAYKSKLAGTNYSFDYSRDITGFIGNMTVTDEYGNTLNLNTSGTVRSFFGKLVKSANFGIAKTYTPSAVPTGAVSIITASGEHEITGINGYEYITADGIYKCAGFEEVYVFDGQGYGHGVGLSQFGSRCMADAGFTFDEIVLTYFPGTAILSLTDSTIYYASN